jgi:eukaryotic-like serine/threonine-protein kinase
MAELSPSRIGPYEQLGTLGAGGMGTVYKARDTRLGRIVAIKISHQGLSERTRREARALAALNHPNVCQIYDVGELDNGGEYLVMEYLEGETLSAKMRRGALPVGEAIGIASAVAAALDAAHRLGIYHRDLKPANVMLTKSGVKLLDFGLVRIEKSARSDESTVTAATAPGTILGTLQYMAPEQLEAQEADARTDIFALGAVLYEMITGQRAFKASSQAGLISAIMSAHPPAVTAVRPGAPPVIDQILGTCLKKDPGDRWQSAHDLRIALEWAVAAEKAQPAQGLAPKRFLLWALPLILLGVALLFVTNSKPTTPQSTQPVRAAILSPADWYFESSAFAISPDGTRLAFVAVDLEGRRRLWVRTLAGSGGQQFDGTEEATLPFWSPDGKRIGFFATGKLKALEVDGGAVRVICDAPTARGGGAWNSSGTIVFSPYNHGVLHRVPESGGTPVPVTPAPRQGSSQSHRWPTFLPDGKRFLFFADWSSPDQQPGNGLYLGSIDGGEMKLIDKSIRGNLAFSSGKLYYTSDRSLRAQPFDVERLQLAGTAASVAEQEVAFHPGFSHSAFSISESGTIVFQSLADSTARLTWLDTSGRESGDIPQLGFSQPRLSPNGRFVVAVSDDARNGKLFVRVYDLARGGSTRITDHGQEESPAWSRDGQRITYSSFDENTCSVYEVPADGSAPPRVLLKGGPMRHFDWSPDGRLVFTEFSEGPRLRVFSPGDSTSHLFGSRAGAEARFSPDGRWIAYASVGAVMVEPYPGPGPRIEISTASGAQPVWSREGKKLYYVTANRELMAVDFDSRTGTAGPPRLVAQTRIFAPSYYGTQYDVAPDGRILINSIPANYSTPLHLRTRDPQHVEPRRAPALLARIRIFHHQRTSQPRATPPPANTDPEQASASAPQARTPTHRSNRECPRVPAPVPLPRARSTTQPPAGVTAPTRAPPQQSPPK